MADSHDFKKFVYKDEDFTCCKVFKKQEEAITYSDLERKSTFSLEVARNGVRYFISCNYEDFWKFYKEKITKNYYEVIKTNQPVKLFYDMEFYKSVNPTLCGQQLTLHFIREVIKELKDIYSIETSEKECLILESTDAKKFSVHLIFYDICFQDIFQLGRFVKNHLSRTTVNVFSKKGEIISFVDHSIYTKNRNFRLLMSSKFGSNRPLLRSKLDISSETIIESSSEVNYNVFLRSLISYTTNAKTIQLTCHEPNKPPRTKDLIQTFEESKSSGIDPEIKLLIEKIIFPGKITMFTDLSENITVFMVSSDKFCMKIGRSHSNNRIFYRHNKRLNILEQSCFSAKCSSLEDIKFIVK